MDACWGLSRGLRRGLLSRLISTTGVCEAPARGWLLADALALFATLWACVSLSLRRQKQVTKSNTAWKNGDDKGRTLTRALSPLPLPSFSSLG